MIKQILDALVCPVCGAAFFETEDGKSLVCAGCEEGPRAGRRHCFDLGGSGYINLASPSQSLSGDSREAIRARSRFLDAGYYAPIREAVCDALVRYAGEGLAVDAGCGEGYYTEGMAACAQSVIGFDLSKFGVDAAAKRAKRARAENLFAAVAGIYEMPLRSRCASAVVSIFAPCAEQEFSRVLQAGGVLIAVGAGEDHLLGLKKAVYKNVYKNTAREDMPRGMRLLEEKRVAYRADIEGAQAISDLFSMTPYYYRTSEEDLAKLNALTSLSTEVDVTVSVYRND